MIVYAIITMALTYTGFFLGKDYAYMKIEQAMPDAIEKISNENYRAGVEDMSKACIKIMKLEDLLRRDPRLRERMPSYKRRAEEETL